MILLLINIFLLSLIIGNLLGFDLVDSLVSIWNSFWKEEEVLEPLEQCHNPGRQLIAKDEHRNITDCSNISDEHDDGDRCLRDDGIHCQGCYGRESNKWYTCKTNPDNNKCIKDKECIAPTNLQQSSDPAEQIPNCHMPVIAPEDKRFERRETTTSRGIVATYDPLGFEEERTSSCKETNLDRCTGGMGILGDENCAGCYGKEANGEWYTCKKPSTPSAMGCEKDVKCLP